MVGLDLNLPFWGAVQGLYITDPTRQHAQEHAVCVAAIPQRELDHTDQGFLCPETASSCSECR